MFFRLGLQIRGFLSSFCGISFSMLPGVLFPAFGVGPSQDPGSISGPQVHSRSLALQSPILRTVSAEVKKGIPASIEWWITAECATPDLHCTALHCTVLACTALPLVLHSTFRAGGLVGSYCRIHEKPSDCFWAKSAAQSLHQPAFVSNVKLYAN